MNRPTETPSRSEIADILGLAPPYGTLETRKLKAALEAEEARGHGDKPYAKEIREAIEHA